MVSARRPGAHVSGRAASLSARAILVATGLALLCAPVAAAPAGAKPGAGKPAVGQAGNTSHMLLESDLVTYNNDSETVVSSGNVRVYYDGKTLTADRLTYYRRTKRLTAEGNARLVNTDGTIVTGRSIDVTENFRDAFVRDLRIETIERSRFAASQVKRSDGNVTVFDNGVYSACQTCVLEPEKPPFWQVKAATIIHNQQERMVYYENASFELFGHPIASLPYFSHPDPTVTRKSGFLSPRLVVSDKLGFGGRVPYFWAPVPDWDVTLSPTPLSRQGILMDMAVRHRTQNGIWSVQMAGIDQRDPAAFESVSSNRDWRGAVFSKGDFNINEQWRWGWDVAALSDRRFAADYKYDRLNAYEASSTVFLTGLGRRNYFDARVYTFQVYTDDDPSLPNESGRFLQRKQPIAATVDYNYIHETPVAGGELGANVNFTTVARDETDLDMARQLRGMGGSYSRLSAEVTWRRQMIDRTGQVWKPFLAVRGDAFFTRNIEDAKVPWIADTTFTRLTPTVGLEYRYPILISSAFGSHIVEPIAQIAARTNEGVIGRLPNEDAHSLVFDDTTLFQTDKFSGWDRVEGGVRANAGLQYTFLAENGMSASAMLGQSYHLAGVNSYANPSEAMLLAAPYLNSRPLTGLGSGLDTRQSDFVGRALINSGGGFRIGAQARVDSKDFKLNRIDAQTALSLGPLTTSLAYAYMRTPDVVYDILGSALAPADYAKYAPARERQELQTAFALRATENWRLFGSMRYDLVGNILLANTVGVGYDNDSFSASLAYIESVDMVTPVLTDGTRNLHDRTIYLQVGFRTLGDAAIHNSLGN